VLDQIEHHNNNRNNSNVAVPMGDDELEEHQAYGDSTLGCNEATEQHKEQSGVRRNAARWR
jgi:hypothetical protein